MKISFVIGTNTPKQVAEQLRADIKSWAEQRQASALRIGAVTGSAGQAKIQAGRAQAFTELLDLLDWIVIE